MIALFKKIWSFLQWIKSDKAEIKRQPKLAKDAKEMKDYLNGITPKARAKFWAGIEGRGSDQEKQTTSGN